MYEYNHLLPHVAFEFPEESVFGLLFLVAWFNPFILGEVLSILSLSLEPVVELFVLNGPDG